MGKMRHELVIAIDGPAGAGKSTTARLLAHRLNYKYIDTGATYRAFAWKAKHEKVSQDDVTQLELLVKRTSIELRCESGNFRVYVDGTDVTDEIRTEEMSKLSSHISAFPGVRKELTVLQRKLGEKGRAVIEGRDVGTVVFPDADLKFFLDATLEERAYRRKVELKGKGIDMELEKLIEEIRQRDFNDSNRKTAPLTKAGDAIYIETTGISIDDVVSMMMKEIEKKDALPNS